MGSLHQRAKEIFLDALDRPASERAAFLDEACAGDAELREEIESLLSFLAVEASTSHGLVARPFEPGDVFAGRYRMVTRLGRGGMGDVWHAEDLILQTPVALKVIHATGPDARVRVLNEVRLARQITHPSVCRVFDVGETEDGSVFYTMELITGEDLAALLRRAGRMPPEKVLETARQLCAGLAAAHGQGVLHRDLKPANILIDDDGRVRITDFGVAIMRADADGHMLTGTPGYMAPEQRTPGAALSERTDVYALGLVLYELLVGRHPFRDTGTSADPPAPSSIVRNVNLHLNQLVMQALSPDPAQRPASAAEFGEALAVTERPRTATGKGLPLVAGPRSTHWMAVSGVVLLIAIAAGASSWLTSARLQPLTAQDTIVLADFQNTTGEPVFDGALKVALAVALEQSPFLKVFPDERARDTLSLMQRPSDAQITRGLAREIARREQLKALIAGSIARLGSNYVLTLEAINAENGDVMAREQAEAARKEDVLTSLGAATSRLREKLGESLASIKRFDAPLPRATTGSIEALHAYALAFSEGPEVPRLRAVPHLQRAIEIDPSFALAHAQLSGVYTNTGQSALAPAYSRRAFELRERVSERERFFISWRYYRDAIQDADKALELARSWTATYPREAFASNALGAALIRVGRFEESIAPFREAIRLDGKFAPAYSNLAAALLASNRYDEARAVLNDASDRKLEFNGLHRLSYLLASIQGDTAAMERELAAGTGANETNAAYGWKAHSLAFAGRPHAAHAEFQRGVELSSQGNFKEVAAQLSVEDAETHALAGQCADVASEVAAALAWSRDNTTLERAGRALALCGSARDATHLSEELTRRFPESTLTNRVAVPVIGAILALHRQDAQHALELLERTKPYDRAPFFEFWPFYLRGLAHLQLGDAPAAAGEFRDIIAHRGTAPVSLMYPLAHLGLARASAVSGDMDGTRRAYEQFFALWRDAESNVRPLAEARAEYARHAREARQPDGKESRAR